MRKDWKQLGSECRGRKEGRKFDELRAVDITRGYLKTADGSVLISMGDTRVLCAATVEDCSPPFLRGTGKGWVTAEYSMLPRSSRVRVPRESTRGRIGGRTHEIQRLIGRSLRAVCDLEALGERTVIVDCDVVEADGGTRTASITGGYIALVDTLKEFVRAGEIAALPIVDSVAAVSVGIVDGAALLDLDYEEDSRAEVDMNIVMTGSGRLVEVQGTAEQKTFSRKDMNGLVDIAEKGIRSLTGLQKGVYG